MEKYTLLNGKVVRAYGNYYTAKNRAEKEGLKLAEYGDVYDSHMSYAFWNKNGNRNEDEKIIAYYRFKDGKPAPLTSEELKRYLFN